MNVRLNQDWLSKEHKASDPQIKSIKSKGSSRKVIIRTSETAAPWKQYQDTSSETG